MMNALGIVFVGLAIGSAATAALFLLLPRARQTQAMQPMEQNQLRVLFGAMTFSVLAWLAIVTLLFVAGVPLNDPKAWGDAPVRNILIGAASFFAIPIGAVTLANAYNRTEILQSQSDQGQRRLEAELISEAVRLVAEKEPASQIGGILTLERLARSNPDIVSDVQQTLESFIRSRTQGYMLSVDQLVDEEQRLPPSHKRDESQKARAKQIEESIRNSLYGVDSEAVQVAMRVLIRTFATERLNSLDLTGVFLKSQYVLEEVQAEIDFSGSFVRWLTFIGETGELNLQGRKHGGNVSFLSADVQSLKISGDMDWLMIQDSNFKSCGIHSLTTENLTWRRSTGSFDNGGVQIRVKKQLEVFPIGADLPVLGISLGYSSSVIFPERASVVDVYEFLAAFADAKNFSEFHPKVMAGTVQTNWPGVVQQYQDIRSSQESKN